MSLKSTANSRNLRWQIAARARRVTLQIPERGHGRRDEWPNNQRCEDKALRVERSTQDVKHAKSGNQHAGQTQKSRSLRIQATEMHHLRHEIWKEQKQSAFEKDDPTINLNGFCRATLLRRQEKSFEHNRNLFRDSE